MSVRWNKMLVSGNKEIDAEHREVIEDANRVFKTINTKNYDTITTELTNFVSNVKDHFIAEEQMMADYQLSELDGHRKLHEKFLEMASEIMAEYRADRSPSSLKKHFKMLCNTMIKHIINYDLPVIEKIQKLQQ